MPAVCQRKRRKNRKAEVTTVSLLVGVGVLQSACRKSACQGPLFTLLKHKLSLASEENSSADFGPLKEASADSTGKQKDLNTAQFSVILPFHNNQRL
ncbi:hypothetical protein ROHU_024475 [Labeo rohita]|uniref:Uncharacterized protein n=1 Tax=Labeo rohita TaxID=84645 RepID=A0A498MIE6_LABRO|nr:hypothetical protein ROHU_024475 [Labeo rohita]